MSDIIQTISATTTTAPATSYVSGPSPVPTKVAPVGHWENDGAIWITASGVKYYRKWVEKYPSLYGPMATDPDGGAGEVECTDAIAQILAKFTGYGGTFSTWTERHAFIIFAGIGYNDVNTSDDVPPIPEFFIPEMAYCYTGLSMGRATKKLEEVVGKTNWAPVIIAAVSALTAGTAFGPQILTILQKVLGT